MKIDFNGSAGPSLGVEVELELVDKESGQLASRATEILDEMAPGEAEHPKAKHELFECTIEIITGVCSSVAEARADLEETLAEVVAGAETRGLGVMCSGTHPFSHWGDQVVTDNPRYHALVAEMGWMAERLAIFGVHVHVGVRSGRKVVAIANALSGYIPHFLALSASSPFWHGRDTGLCSSRSKVFESLPTAGLPEQISDWSTFEQFMETLVSASAIKTVREVWWDIRPHPDFGTVELRMCDGLPRMAEVEAVAALSQSLVHWLDCCDEFDHALPVPTEWVLRQNKWRAARHGLDAEVIVDEQGTTIPMRTAIEDLVELVRPAAAELDCVDQLEGVARIMADGPSAVRQRAVAESSGTRAVVDALVHEMATDEPLWSAP